ncbi:MAG: hypothetical protein E7643_06415 [Ruminococcaceae bacterium]|nr:hypothetical protein [Oscillospiraceae bacterium]
MKQRIITGLVATCVLIVNLIFARTPLLLCSLALASVISVFELARCVGLHKAYPLCIPLYVLAAICPFVTRYAGNFADLFEIGGWEDLATYAGDLNKLRHYALIVIMVMMFYFFAMMTFSRGKYKVTDVSVLFMVSLYILLGINGIVVMHDYRTGGEILYITIFIGAWVTDIFAYFCGMLFGRGGKHKLIPDVSPKKTVEGSIGGIVFCVLVMWIYGLLCTKFSTHDSYLWFFVIGGLIASIVAQLGDLLMSVVKRNYGIKDYGKIFPGHGGMLDRLDSMFAVSVALMAFSSFFGFFKGI